MLFLFLLFPFAEAYMFYKFIDAYSFVDALFLVFLSGVLGITIMKLQGKATLMSFQQNLMQGQLPDRMILHRALVVVGGLLLLIPGIISDVLGVLCILPGSRHLLVWYLKAMFAKGFLKGRVYTQGFARTSAGPNFKSAGGFTYSQTNHHRTERDAEVVDIEPIEISHQRKEEL
ncbi:MAG: FxsA family protein [Pseudobdellovibrionaceae bacterium]